MPLLHGKYISTTLARKRLPELVTRVQDPREWVVLTRHGREVAAVVSFEDLKRIFDLHDADAKAARPPLPDGLVRIPGGGIGTPRQAAEKVLQVQMDRKREREVLEAGGLSVVRGGEIRSAEGSQTSGGGFEDLTGGAPGGEVGRDGRRRWWWFWR